uniref:Uncharacterized protein n=1 Tax=Romanomermis culicivorax TaxID=13658 RepID=A0A915IZJ3_ROMCU
MEAEQRLRLASFILHCDLEVKASAVDFLFAVCMLLWLRHVKSLIENKLMDLLENIDLLYEITDEDWEEEYQVDRPSIRKDLFQMSSSN